MPADEYGRLALRNTANIVVEASARHHPCGGKPHGRGKQFAGLTDDIATLQNATQARHKPPVAPCLQKRQLQQSQLGNVQNPTLRVGAGASPIPRRCSLAAKHRCRTTSHRCCGSISVVATGWCRRSAGQQPAVAFSSRRSGSPLIITSHNMAAAHCSGQVSYDADARHHRPHQMLWSVRPIWRAGQCVTLIRSILSTNSSTPVPKPRASKYNIARLCADD